MRSLFSTTGMARASARHPWRTLGLWLVVIVVAVALAAGMGELGTDGGEFTNTPDAQRAAELVEARLEGQSPLTETVVIQSRTATVDDPAFQAVVERTSDALLGLPGVVASAPTYYQARAAGGPEAETMVSADRRTTIIPVTLTGGLTDLIDEGAAYVATAEGEAGDGFAVYAVGDLSGAEVYNAIAEEDLGKELTIGLPVAAAVLVVVFGALVAAGVPIVLGLVSILVASGLSAVLASVLTITSDVQAMITMIGLAVGIDYALFFVERYREERRHGIAKQEAIAVAGGTAGKAVPLLRRHRRSRPDGDVPHSNQHLSLARGGGDSGGAGGGDRDPDLRPRAARLARRQDRLAAPPSL